MIAMLRILSVVIIVVNPVSVALTQVRATDTKANKYNDGLVNEWQFLRHHFVIVRVSSDPKPQNAATMIKSKCSVMSPDSDRPHIVYFLKVE